MINKYELKEFIKTDDYVSRDGQRVLWQRLLQRNEDSCIIKDTNVIKTIETAQGTCVEEIPLELRSTIKTYPLMPNAGAIRVNYWEGVLTKEIKHEVLYEVNYYDICIGRQTISIKKKYEEVF